MIELFSGPSHSSPIFVERSTEVFFKLKMATGLFKKGGIAALKAIQKTNSASSLKVNHFGH
jgi:hypothetical protein